ncbi:putative protein kinase [Leishmania infantum JPCM5]|uniref:Protein kinase domain-containing protein n=2 Tax=Leishmania infantum TaxID=5671 RepID=A4I5I5_LEIIN|nr:putative protein kinase [Leishmania infantum JPCM5]CAM70055.2 putative protein kinase [Leishmania infantum JPCM5]|eukprot:XP_001467004.2 putative protein kinase [Leishmania infantum JPCM5]
MASTETVWDGACLLLATDVAGVLHCYQYTTEKVSDGSTDNDDERVAVLTHLWSHSLGDEDVPSELVAAADGGTSPTASSIAASAKAERDARAGFKCALSKRLRLLEPASTMLARWAAAEGPRASGEHRDISSASPKSGFTEGHSRVNGGDADGACDTAARGTREGKIDGIPPVAAAHHFGLQAIGASCPFCKRVSFSSSSPSPAFTSPYSPCTPRFTSTSAATATQKPTCATTSATTSLLCSSTAGRAAIVRRRSEVREETVGDRRVSDASGDNFFRPCDFMARIPEAAYSGFNASAKARPAAAAGSITPVDLAAPTVGCASSQLAEVAWYWRCPRCVVDARATPDGGGSDAKRASHRYFVSEEEAGQLSRDDTAMETGDLAEVAATAHLWMPLPEAVRHWNAVCCHHHRLLLLRHMEEGYIELDLFTGASLDSIYMKADMKAAVSAEMLDSTSSFDISAHSIYSSVSDGSGTEVSHDSCASISDANGDGLPRAVLSLTTQRYETLIMQATVSRSSAKVTKGRKTRKETMTAPTQKAAHTCLAKLAAPAIQLGLTWHAPRQRVRKDLSFSDADDEAVVERQQGEAELLATSQVPAVLSFSSVSSENTLHHGSTSASDIDMDVMAGRKQLPPQYHFLRAVSPAPSSSAISATSPRGIRNEPTKWSREKPARPKYAGTDRSAESSAGREAVPNEIPVRCGPGGCVYRAVSATLDSFTAAGNGDSAPLQFLLLLQLPLPLVEAFWVTLPSSSASGCSQNGGDAAFRRRAGERSMSAVELRRVPWLPRDACSLRVVEVAAGAPISASSASEARTTLRGFVLEASEVPSARRAMSTGLPRVLRALSAYDVFSARRATVRSAWLARDRRGDCGPFSASSDAGERERAAEAAAAPEHRNGTRAVHTKSFSTPFPYESRETSSSITHIISSPPRHYIPAASFFDENFEPLMLLGRGVGGAVLLARHRFTGVFYAIKVLVARDYDSERDILQEVRIHAMLENRHLVRYHTCWSEVISATRAQQLAFIGVCHPYEANLGRCKRLNSASSSMPMTTRQSARDGASHSPTNSDGDMLNRSQSRGAPGGWRHLILPSLSSMMLVGSDSTSGAVTPEKTPMRSHPQLRGDGRRRLIVDGFADDLTDDDGDAMPVGQAEKRQGAADDCLRHSGKGISPPTKIGSQPSRRPLTFSSTASPSAWGTRASLTAHRLRKQLPITSVLSPGTSSAASNSVSGTTVQGVADSEGEDLESIWDDAQGSDSDRSEGSGDSYGSSQRPEENTIIGTRVVFLQMELCQGTLAQYLASRTSIDRVENLIIAMQVVAGLRYLHHRGILHRDVKPTNVFMNYRCQYHKEVHQTNLSSTSGADDGSEDEDDTRSFWGFPGSATSHSGASAAWHGDRGNEACAPSPSSTLTLCRRHPSSCPPTLASSGCGPSVSCAPRRSSMVPPGMQELFRAASSLTSGWKAETTMTSLDNLPSWDGERAALDFVMHPPHRTATEMLQERLLRRPPPPAARQRASSKCKLMKEEMTAADATMPLVQSDGGRHFLRRLASWLLRRFVQVQLGDLGLAKFLYQQELRVDGFVSMNAINTIGVGSPLYASPEQLKGNRCTPASDAFSVGVVLAEMYLQPKTTAERLTVLREVREGVYRDKVLLAQFPELKLVRRLTEAQPECRMTLAAVHKALRSFLEQALQDELYRHYE